ncbi:MAG TPA: MBOAT family O-acyltransferase [Thermoleophilaceae bacterium]|nr:MBOAT family O-acyltransferase [Thermoleophilaceae bacterium]
MVFPSIQFAIFLPLVLAISWALMPRPKLWKPFILAASYLFYAAASPRYCLLLAAVTLANQLGAVAVHRARDERRQKAIIAATVGFDLAVLGVFKYYGFFANEIGAFLDDIGLPMPLPLLTLALPIGLSFITFQAISYSVDVKRGLLAPASTLDFAIYLSFFPHVVAGPIVRAREFIPQLSTPRDPRNVAVGAGVVLVMLGLIKKVAIADLLAREVVDPVFAVPQAYAAPDVLLAAYAYAAQIYCDFSGYTDIAIGVALLAGFVFPQNFRSPYRSISFREFWQRWHITLSRFLRDFLYIPLGGNRGGRWKTARNLMLTMVLGGLWHGAAWGFVLWGTVHGLALVTEHQLRGRVKAPPVWLRWAIVFHVVVLAWVLFRAETLTLAGEFFSRLVVPGDATLFTPAVVAAVVAVIGFQLLPERPLERLRERIADFRPVALAASLALVVVVVGSTVPSQGVPPFIYFQF